MNPVVEHHFGLPSEQILSKRVFRDAVEEPVGISGCSSIFGWWPKVLVISCTASIALIRSMVPRLTAVPSSIFSVASIVSLTMSS